MILATDKQRLQVSNRHCNVLMGDTDSLHSHTHNLTKWNIFSCMHKHTASSHVMLAHSHTHALSQKQNCSFTWKYYLNWKLRLGINACMHTRHTSLTHTIFLVISRGEFTSANKSSEGKYRRCINCGRHLKHVVSLVIRKQWSISQHTYTVCCNWTRGWAMIGVNHFYPLKSVSTKKPPTSFSFYWTEDKMLLCRRTTANTLTVSCAWV